MANTDGFIEGLAAQGQNKTIAFKGGYFSFAFGNEIALCIDGEYWILNCDHSLWKSVKEKVKKTKTKKELIKWWKEQSNNFEINDWSSDFETLNNND